MTRHCMGAMTAFYGLALFKEGIIAYKEKHFW
jgi:hypothetical protein